MSKDKSDGILGVVRLAAQLSGQALHRSRSELVGEAAGKLGERASTSDQLTSAWRAAGLDGEPKTLSAVEQADLPVIGWHPDHGWLIVQRQNADASWSAHCASGEQARLDSLEATECMSIPRRSTPAISLPSAAGLVWRAVWQRRLIFLEAVGATLLVNLLALSISLYTMQVYDRVIPNQGFDTLWVLSVGVAIAIGIEFLLRQVRAVAIDRTGNAIDKELSAWFFGRALGIRMEARPQSVGTLASQVRGFEAVRAVMTSTPLFVLIDVPFGILFIAMIFVVGGKLALVPIATIPLCLLAGLFFQAIIQRNAQAYQNRSNQKTGLLVEAIDGAELLKANSADWKIQARWNRLIEQVSDSEYEMRRFASFSQQLTQSLQQAGYVAIIAYGAYLVADNQITLGVLIGCAIITNRALAPVLQLPGVMVQWAHARAAIAGLDKIIGLPSETESDRPTLMPAEIHGELRFEDVKFSYMPEAPPALQLQKLVLRPGERTAIIGAIGSGKSALLKVASGLFRPAQGKVFLDGIEMSLISDAFLRERIGYLPQEARLFSGTLRDNLLLGLPDPGDEAILEAARKTGLFDLIAAHPKGLALPIAEGGRGVSGGQCQQVGLTRLVLARPRLWLLDEPTAAMDAAAEQRILALLAEVVAGGAMLVVSTHKTALLRVSDRIVVMQGGKVAFDGPRDQVLARAAAMSRGEGRAAPESAEVTR